MRVVVFGGSGGIGASVVDSLDTRGDAVIVASRREPAQLTGSRWRWAKCDIRDFAEVDAVLKNFKPRVVVHLAAALQFACDRDPEVSVRTNVLGTANILKASAIHGIERFVFGSSVAVYGGIARDKLREEDSPPTEDIGVYGAAKRFEESLGITYGRLHGYTFVALRYCGVFGAGTSKSPGMARVRGLIEETSTGKTVTISDASGEERAQLTYVKDAAAATLSAVDCPSPKHSVYNVAGPDNNYISLREYHSIIRQQFPEAGHVYFTGEASNLPRMDTTRIRIDMGFIPKFSVYAGLQDWAASR